MDETSLQLGATFILAISLIELVKFVVSKYVRKNERNGVDKEILKEIQLMNSNHLNSICKTMDEGNDRIVGELNTVNKDVTKAIHEMHLELANRLSELKGKLK